MKKSAFKNIAHKYIIWSIFQPNRTSVNPKTNKRKRKKKKEKRKKERRKVIGSDMRRLSRLHALSPSLSSICKSLLCRGGVVWW